jgi:hypothetical protein
MPLHAQMHVSSASGVVWTHGARCVYRVDVLVDGLARRGSVSRAKERTLGRSRPPAQPAGRRTHGTHGRSRVMLPSNALHAACTDPLHSCDIIGQQGGTLAP